jgi:hypothetical protein
MNSNRPSRKLIRPLVLAFTIAGMPAAALASAPASTAATCATTTATWGSLPKSAIRPAASPITNIRAGRQACFDRMVVDLRGLGTAGSTVRYVSQVRSDGSGEVVPLRGGARLSVVVRAPAYDSAGRATYHPANQRELVNVAGYSAFRQVAWAGTFEGQTTIGLGVRARLPMRVFVLNGPGTGSRVVIDVAHHW